MSSASWHWNTACQCNYCDEDDQLESKIALNTHTLRKKKFKNRDLSQKRKFIAEIKFNWFILEGRIEY